ncbi:hypothetical protein MRB53_009672 [Persea americana]|uniref:Uncharacterized protein n=1 Tax=Persea americana TaxID=3435 RepID=A0ACC2LQ09_PERAE|nr:hypothetical protein MRB53_009672 [Persea americana]
MFLYTISSSLPKDLVLRFDIHKKLDKHRGCVNTVWFKEGGDILISGSDDRMVMLWNWNAGRVKLSFHSEHTNNVFQAKMISYSDDLSIVTCVADGQWKRSSDSDNGAENKNHRSDFKYCAVVLAAPYEWFKGWKGGNVGSLLNS